MATHYLYLTNSKLVSLVARRAAFAARREFPVTDAGFAQFEKHLAGLADVPVVVGGIVPDADERKLRKAGVKEVFHPGASREEIVSKVAKLAGEARAAKNKELLA